MRSPFAGAVSITALFVVAATAPGQAGAPPVRLEWRGDVFLARVNATHAGIGLSTDLGGYVRLDGLLAVGGAWADREAVASARGDLTTRFLLDPYRQARWGVYGGAGVSTRYERGPGVRVLLTLHAGTEIPGNSAWRPAVEAGVGGGVRLGVVFRPRRESRR